MINWTTATDDELDELYDALYERHSKLSNVLAQIHSGTTESSRKKQIAFCHEILRPSKDLCDSVMDEIVKRRKEKNETDGAKVTERVKVGANL
jgi:hypothetical protein